MSTTLAYVVVLILSLSLGSLAPNTASEPVIDCSPVTFNMSCCFCNFSSAGTGKEPDGVEFAFQHGASPAMDCSSVTTRFCCSVLEHVLKADAKFLREAFKIKGKAVNSAKGKYFTCSGGKQSPAICQPLLDSGKFKAPKKRRYSCSYNDIPGHGSYSCRGPHHTFIYGPKSSKIIIRGNS